MDCDAAFDEWYAGQRHQLANEELCRLIWRKGWMGAESEWRGPLQDCEIAMVATYAPEGVTDDDVAERLDAGVEYGPETVAELRRIVDVARHAGSLMRDAEWLFTGWIDETEFKQRTVDRRLQAMPRPQARAAFSGPGTTDNQNSDGLSPESAETHS